MTRREEEHRQLTQGGLHLSLRAGLLGQVRKALPPPVLSRSVKNRWQSTSQLKTEPRATRSPSTYSQPSQVTRARPNRIRHQLPDRLHSRADHGRVSAAAEEEEEVRPTLPTRSMTHLQQLSIASQPVYLYSNKRQARRHHRQSALVLARVLIKRGL